MLNIVPIDWKSFIIGLLLGIAIALLLTWELNEE